MATTRINNILFFLENLLYLRTDLKGVQYLSGIRRVVKGAAIERENEQENQQIPCSTTPAWAILEKNFDLTMTGCLGRTPLPRTL